MKGVFGMKVYLAVVLSLLMSALSWSQVAHINSLEPGFEHSKQSRALVMGEVTSATLILLDDLATSASGIMQSDLSSKDSLVFEERATMHRLLLLRVAALIKMGATAEDAVAEAVAVWSADESLDKWTPYVTAWPSMVRIRREMALIRDHLTDVDIQNVSASLLNPAIRRKSPSFVAAENAVKLDKAQFVKEASQYYGSMPSHLIRSRCVARARKAEPYETPIAREKLCLYLLIHAATLMDEGVTTASALQQSAVTFTNKVTSDTQAIVRETIDPLRVNFGGATALELKAFKGVERTALMEVVAAAVNDEWKTALQAKNNIDTVTLAQIRNAYPALTNDRVKAYLCSLYCVKLLLKHPTPNGYKTALATDEFFLSTVIPTCKPNRFFTRVFLYAASVVGEDNARDAGKYTAKIISEAK